MQYTPMWIAERSYERGLAGNVNVAVAAPQLVESGEWTCAVRVWDGETSKTTIASGEDAMQALLLGLSMLRIRLETSGIAGLNWVGIAGHNIELVP
jgi:hypothetical protein